MKSWFRNEGDRPLLAKTRNLVCFLLGCLLFLSCSSGEPSQATPQPEPSIPEQFSDFEILHQVTFPTGYSFEETELGGLSGITYDPRRDLYYAISDDRSIKAPARFYTFRIDTNAGTVEPIATTFLKDELGETFPPLSLDPEAITLIGEDRLLIASEGDRERQIEPLIAEFSLEGNVIRQFPLPEKFLLGTDKGVRNNRALESLTATSDGEIAFTASEAALVQDGEDATLEQGSPTRIVQYDVATGEPQQEFLYYTDPLPFESNLPGGFSTGGLVELLALDRTHLLSMERAFAEGVGNAVRIFEVSLERADDISSIESLLNVEGDRIQPARKKLLLALEPPGAIVDNLEGILFGTPLPDGRQTLILMSDNNFNSIQITQFLIIANPKMPE